MSVPSSRPADLPRTSASARPYLLRRSPLEAFLRRAVEHRRARRRSTSPGSTIGLYLALALRSLVRDPKPILWNLLWNAGERLAPVPRAAAAARLLAQPPLRRRASCARAPGRSSPRSCSSRRSRSRSRSARASTSRRSASTSSAAISVATSDQPAPLELRDDHRGDAALGSASAAACSSSATASRSTTCARRSARAAAGSTTSSSGASRPAPACSTRARRRASSTS